MRADPAVFLSPYRVLDLTRDEGSLCAKLLADFGADVIKVESPQGCATRRFPPMIEGRADLDASLWFHAYNGKKRSITLNSRVPTGRQLLMDLAAQSHVVLWSDHEMSESDLSPSSFEAANHSLILATFSGFAGERRALDETEFLVASGLLALSGNPDEEPCLPPHGLVHPTASLFAAIGILAMLQDDGREEHFVHLDANAYWAASLLTDSSIAKVSQGGVPRREGDAYSFIVPGRLYACEDGYVRIIGGQSRHWTALVDWMGADQLRGGEWQDRLYRNQHRDEIETEIEKFTGSRTRAWLFEEGQRRRVPISPVFTPEEFLKSSWPRERSFLQDIDSTLFGRVAALASPFIIDGERPVPRLEGPRLGQHNWEVFVRDTCLMSNSEMASLFGAGVL